jgi:5,10-methylenetetrahydromethanopterin reductase
MFDDSAERFTERVRRADELGFAYVGWGDSQCLFGDTYVAGTLAALNTTRALIGPFVTNPVTRHPSVTANAIRSVDEISGGRACLPIGTGASAVRAVGERPATRRGLADYTRTVRALLAGDTAEWEGTTFAAQWRARPVPIYLSAYGPATARLAGGVGDGVVLAGSTAPDVLADYVDLVRQGELDAHREPGSMAAVKPLVSAATYSAFRNERAVTDLGPDLRDPVREYVRRYEVAHHVQSGGPNEQLLDALDLTEPMVARFALAGTLETCRRRLRSYEDLGISHVVVPAVTGDPDQLIEQFGRLVPGLAGS